ncbi:hypothetical protein LCGC14_0327390 [marine sediment metagenome]|uniref:Uncharacterized protein n=1 Tax=marine sediment metagenome TaxID=412755 RepID=A0A0F9U028_9ZZZZ
MPSEYTGRDGFNFRPHNRLRAAKRGATPGPGGRRIETEDATPIETEEGTELETEG